MEFFGGGDDLVQLMNHWFKHAVRTRGGTGRRMDKQLSQYYQVEKKRGGVMENCKDKKKGSKQWVTILCILLGSVVFRLIKT